MALPFVLPDSSLVQPGGRPRKVGMDFYLVVRGGSDATTIKMLKTSDPTSSWAEVDAANRPTFLGDVEGIIDTIDGVQIHIVTHDTNSEVDYHTFNTMTNLWAITNEQIVSTGEPPRDAVAVGVRSDGDIIAAYQGVPENVSAADRQRVYIARREMGTWTADIRVDALGATTTEFETAIGLMGDTVGDRFYISYHNVDTPRSLFLSVFKSDNTFSVQDGFVDGSVAFSFTSRSIDTLGFDQGGTTKIKFCYKDGNELIGEAVWDDADTPVVTRNILVSNVPNNAFECALAVDDTTQHALFLFESNIWHNVTGEGDNAWGQETVELAVSSGRVFSSNVYVSGNERVLAYVYNDVSTATYNERTLEVLAPPAGTIMTQDAKFTGMEIITVPSDYVLITPDDNADLDPKAGGLYIGATAGDIVVRTGLSDTTSRTIPVAAFSYVPGEFVRVLATGTTATPIFALNFRS